MKLLPSSLHANGAGAVLHACEPLCVFTCVRYMLASLKWMDEFAASPRFFPPGGGGDFFSSLHVHKYMSTQKAYLSVLGQRLTGKQGNNLSARRD